VRTVTEQGLSRLIAAERDDEERIDQVPAILAPLRWM
jgi:hypothetical protein